MEHLSYSDQITENNSGIQGEEKLQAHNVEVLDKGSFYTVVAGIPGLTEELSLHGEGNQLRVDYSYDDYPGFGTHKDIEKDGFSVAFDQPIEQIDYDGKISEDVTDKHLDYDQQFTFRILDQDRGVPGKEVTIRITIPKQENDNK
jgi:hypothetical protein